ncbi:MAG: MTAP family purine nucleoside phosphorylase [Candidatus Micrarchaeia archaeon]
MLGIIGGSGFYELGGEISAEEIFTPYGDALVYRYKIKNKEAVFVARHGKNHSLPPHKINYRANVYALCKIGVNAVFATYATGIIKKYRIGDLILIDDFIGFEKPITFFDNFSKGMRHTDFTNPFDNKLKEKVIEAAAIHRIKLKKGGIIKTTPGPRFESRAEIKMYGKLGANLISMTNAYETILLKEMEIPFCGVAIGTNYACGISKKPLTHGEVIENMASKNKILKTIALELVNFIED